MEKAFCISGIRVDSVIGWGLTVESPLDEMGKISAVSNLMGCANPECPHRGHDPADVVREWTPGGDLFVLGPDVEQCSLYYLLFSNGYLFLVRKIMEPQRHSRLEMVARIKINPKLVSGPSSGIMG